MRRSSAKETRRTKPAVPLFLITKRYPLCPRRFQHGFSVTGETRFRLPKKLSAKLLGGGVIFRIRYVLAPAEHSLKTEHSEFVSPYKRICNCLLELSISKNLLFVNKEYKKFHSAFYQNVKSVFWAENTRGFARILFDKKLDKKENLCYHNIRNDRYRAETDSPQN